MDTPLASITFFRSKLQFLYIFVGILIFGAFAFGVTEGLTTVAIIFILLILLIILFFYQFYLNSGPVVEILGDSIQLKEIYHPLFKWRFVFKVHNFSFNQIQHINVVKNKDQIARSVKINYHNGISSFEARINKSDISEFGSFVKLLEDSTPNVVKDYTVK